MSAGQPPGDRPTDLLDTPEAGGVAIRGTIVRTLGFGVITLLGLISAPVLARHLHVVDFGRYTTVISLVTLVSLVTDAGISALGVRELAVLDPAAKESMMRNLVGIRLVLTAIGMAGAVGFAALAGYGPRLVAGTALAGVGAVCYATQGTVSLPLAAELKLGWVTAAEVTRQAVYVLAIVLLVVAGAGIVPLLAAMIPAGIAGTLVLVWVLRGHVAWRPSLDVAAWRRIAREAFPIAAASVINSTYFRVVILLMSVIAAAVQTGYFALSFRVVEILVTVPMLVVGSLMPILSRAARDDEERLAYAFRRTYDVALAAGAYLTLLTYVGAPLAMSVLTGDARSPAVDVLRIESITLLAVFINVAYGTVLIALRRHRALVVANLVTLGATLAAATVLVPLAGARGGAAAAAGGEWALLAAYFVGLRQARPRLRPSQWVLPRAAIAAAAALAAAAAVHLPRVPNLGSVVIAAVVYAAALALLRGIPPEVLHAVRRERSAPA